MITLVFLFSCVVLVCSTGDLRLMGGSSESQGRVEICLGGKWGTVADVAWNNNAAMVVCRQLGYRGKINILESHNHRKSISYITAGSSWVNTYSGCAPIYLHSATCNGNENRLVDCTLDTDTREDTHSQDVGAMCSGRGIIYFNGINSRMKFLLLSTCWVP